MTVIELLNLSLKDAGIVGIGQVANADAVQDAFTKMKMLLATWTDEGFMIPFITEGSFALVSGQASYTIGPAGADVTAIRPEGFLSGCFVRSASTDYPITLCSMERYNQQPLKGTGGIPWMMAYNPTFPSGTMSFYPTPDAADTFYYQADVTLAEPANIFADVSFPKAYEPALYSNLVMFLAGAYGLQPSPLIAALSQSSKQAIVKRNLTNRRTTVIPEFQLNRSFWYDVHGGP